MVDSNALKSRIQSGDLQAVVLDVWENEPNIDTELLEMVDIGTPHIAGYSLDGKIAGMIMIYNSVCKYFGIEPKYDTNDFLPEPEVKTIEINQDSENNQDALLDAVRRIYNIEKDDAALRQMLKESAENRGGFFDILRKNYYIRREFQNTEVVLDDNNGTLAKKICGIGFRVAGK